MPVALRQQFPSFEWRSLWHLTCESLKREPGKGGSYMSRIPVKTVNSPRRVLNHLAQLMKSVHEKIRARAFQQQHGEGHKLEDWLEAERDVLYSPPCIVTEAQTEIHLQAARPGADAKSLALDVSPHASTVQ